MGDSVILPSPSHLTSAGGHPNPVAEKSGDAKVDKAAESDPIWAAFKLVPVYGKNS
jgi:hypothetical protein